MCVACLVTVRPERGRTCLESGAYLVNFAACQQCLRRGVVVSRQREQQEEENDDGDYEQTISYTHACGHCEHEIAAHYFSFSVTHPTLVPDAALTPLPSSSARVAHDYLMDCALCGRATDSSHTVNDVVSHLDAPHRPRPAHNPPSAVHRSVHLSATLTTSYPLSHPPQGTADVEDAEWE